MSSMGGMMMASVEAGTAPTKLMNRSILGIEKVSRNVNPTKTILIKLSIRSSRLFGVKKGVFRLFRLTRSVDKRRKNSLEWKMADQRTFAAT
jgi:hypothetical protein